MRILYGLPSEGMGHATRSKVVIAHLRARGHQVRVLTSGRAYELMRRAVPDVVRIEGFRMAYRDGTVDYPGTVARNVLAMPQMLARNGAALLDCDAFAPDLVVSDFELFSCGYAHSRGLPVVSIDNNQMIGRCVHDPAVLGDIGTSVARARAFAAMMTPECDHYIVTSFFFPPLRPECRARTTLVPPIVRPEIVAAAAEARDGEHVLVYQTVQGDTRLLEALAAHPAQRFVVYGQHAPARAGNVELKAFDEHGFVADLRTARAVVANGGMSLLGEAMYLGKPVYAVPLRFQAEQALNAGYLAHLGYGASSVRFDAGALGDFLARVPEYAARIRAAIRPDGNARLHEVLDRVLPAVVARRGQRSQ